MTRRSPNTWSRLKVGDVLVLIEKGMGLRKGERHVVLAHVRIVSVRVEPLDLRRVTKAECRREGLAHMTPREFVAFWVRAHRHAGDPPMCRRIEWVYID